MRGRLRSVAVEGPVTDRHGSVPGHVDTELNLLEIFASALGVTIGGTRGSGIAWPRVVCLVAAVEFDRRQVVVDLLDIEAEVLDGPQYQGGLDRIAVVGQSLQGSAD